MSVHSSVISFSGYGGYLYLSFDSTYSVVSFDVIMQFSLSGTYAVFVINTAYLYDRYGTFYGIWNSNFIIGHVNSLFSPAGRTRSSFIVR